MTSKIKLILGTAEFSPSGYPEGQEPVTLNMVNSILRCAKMNGIKILEGAEAYNCDELLQDTDFDLIYKVTHPYSLDRVLERTKRHKLMGLLYHHGLTTDAQKLSTHARVDYIGSSVYSHKQLNPADEMIEVPLNLDNGEFANITAQCKIVRSVFNRGELLKTHSIKECLDFVKQNKTVQALVIGVRSVGELEQFLAVWRGV